MMNVCVIGAGVAGLTCARLLQRRGWKVQVFEASDGVGGRVRSDERDGFILDRGFQVLFDAYPAVQRQLDLKKLDLCAFDPGGIICENGRRHVLTDPTRDSSVSDIIQAGLNTVVSPLDKLRTLRLAIQMRSQDIEAILSGPDTTTEAWLRNYGFSEEMIDLFFRPFYGGIFLDRTLQTSAKCFKFDFMMLSKGQTVVPAAGMGQISQQLARELVERGAIHLHAPVAALTYKNGSVTGVRLHSGQHIPADVVIVATPAPEITRLTGLAMPTEQRSTVTLYFHGTTPIYQSKKILLNGNRDAVVNNAQLVSNVADSYASRERHLLSVTLLGEPTGTDEDLYRMALMDLHRMLAGDHKAQAALAQYQPLACYRIPYAQFAQPPGIHLTLPDNRTEVGNLFIASEITEASSLNAAMISGEKCAASIGA